MSGIACFGELVYSCSLKQGIRDGFLASCKAVKVHIDRDVEGYRPGLGQLYCGFILFAMLFPAPSISGIDTSLYRPTRCKFVSW